MAAVLKRLREIAQNPGDPALEITFTRRQTGDRRKFTGALGVLLDALEAYNPDDVEVAELWVCPDCAFGFDKFHKCADDRYACPVCAEQRQRTALREIADIAHRNKRMVCGMPHGPLARIADIVEGMMPSVSAPGDDDG